MSQAETPVIAYRYYLYIPTATYHLRCELKQTVPLLERELTPAEIRIGRGTPSWVDETGIPALSMVAKPVTLSIALLGCLMTG